MQRWTAAQSIQHYTDLFQPRVPEPVIAVGVLQPAGAWGTMAMSKLSPAAAMLGRSRHNKKAGGLAQTSSMRRPRLAGMAVTAEPGLRVQPRVQARRLAGGGAVGDVGSPRPPAGDGPGPPGHQGGADVRSTGEHFELEATTVGDDGFSNSFLGC